MSNFYRLLIFIAFSLASASAQSVVGVSTQGVVAPPHPSWLTEPVVFEFLYKHVMLTESHANELLAAGKDDSPERHRFKKLAHLTDQEEALLKSTAADAQNAPTDPRPRPRPPS